MLVGAKVCDLTEDLLWFVCGLHVGILTSSPMLTASVMKEELAKKREWESGIHGYSPNMISGLQH